MYRDEAEVMELTVSRHWTWMELTSRRETRGRKTKSRKSWKERQWMKPE